ncbi:MAG TPA: MFS transporter, partial [Acidimicrobiales bacterium]|nr:MFS transporter [Acidimicrobiales bacterium]
MTQSGYGPVLRHPVAKRLLTIQAISEAGDFVGLSALLVLSYTRTGTVLAPAAVYAARTMPSLAVGTVFSGWLDRPPRRAALVVLALCGAILLGTVAAFPTFGVALAVAAVLGAQRTASVSISTATMAEAVDPALHRPYFALVNTVNQMAQVIGILTGAGVTLLVGASIALGFDAATFLVAAALLLGLPTIVKKARDRRPPPTEGLRIIRRQPTLWLLAPVLWAAMAGSVLPETMGTRVAGHAWIPIVMAASPIGAMLGAVLIGRTRILDDVSNQLRMALVLGAVFVLGGVVLAAGAPAALIAVVNMAIGASSVWTIGIRATFVRLTPPPRLAQVEATLVSSAVFCEGVGVLLL